MPTATPTPATDRAALTALYNGTDGANWSSNRNWLSDAPLDEWYGVATAADGRVTELFLEQNRLSGEIPPELGNLSDLEWLHLSGNQLSGCIPGGLLYVPNNDLSSLDLPLCASADRDALVALYNETGGPRWTYNDNWLSDAPIGEWRGVVTDRSGRVTELRLVGNQLSGQIPAELGSLTSLIVLSLHANQLSGQIPAELGSLANLTGLGLGENQLSGQIPAKLGNLTNLEFLGLVGNQLSGQIPAELGSLANLGRLYLRDNRLSGEIPLELGSLTNLEELRLGGNQFTGCIPEGLRDVPKNDLSDVGLPLCGAPLDRATPTARLTPAPTAAATPTSTTAKEIRLSLLGAWPEGITITDWQEAAMIAKMNELGQGSLSVHRVAGPADVYQAEQMAALRNGIYDILHTASSYFRGLTQLPNVEAFLGGAPVSLRESCGLEDIFREIYDEQVGVHYLGPSTYNSSAHIYLSELANEDRTVVDLTGLKLRGHAGFQRGTEALGGSIVNMPASQVYTAVQRGVIEGSVAGGDYMYARDVRWDEIMNYAYDIDLDKESGHVYMNKDVWLSLTQQQQDAIYNGLVQAFEELAPELADRKAEALATLRIRGVQVIRPPEEEVRRVQALWIEKNVSTILNLDPVNAPRVLIALRCIWDEMGIDVNL